MKKLVEDLWVWNSGSGMWSNFRIPVFKHLALWQLSLKWGILSGNQSTGIQREIFEILCSFISMFNILIDSSDNTWFIFQLIIAKKENVGESPQEEGVGSCTELRNLVNFLVSWFPEYCDVLYFVYQIDLLYFLILTKLSAQNRQRGFKICK